VELYKRHLPEVFDRSTWQAMAGMGNLLREKYDEQPLERTLQRYFGDCRLSEALTNVVVPAFDLVSGRVLLFDSEVAKTHTTLDLPMRLVVRGATAAPTYFEPEPIGPPFVIEDHLLVDGGIFANNPGMCAFMQAQRRHRGADVVMVSLGTGSVARSLRQDEVRSWGVAHWARPLFNLVLASASQATDLNLRSLLGDRRYFRFEADLDLYGCSHRLDDVSEGNLMALEKAGRGMIMAQSEEIDRACQLLAP
jgi:patatin-like phospholipase/acyl hydrolase